MLEFTDLHLHLLPAVDDGPRNAQESVELARQLVADGITRCVVTPHFNAWNPGVLANLSDVSVAVERLKELLSQNGITLEVHPGAEHFLTPELIVQVQRKEAPLLGPGPYILVEFPFDTRPLYADDLLYQLSLLGLSPVLAHPARYSWVQSDPDALERLISSGVYLQMTAGSISGTYGPRVQRTVTHILRNGWYSLAGTDLHHPGQPRSLRSCFEAVATIAGPTAADVLLVQNPARVLDGQALLLVHPADPELSSPKKRFRLPGF